MNSTRSSRTVLGIGCLVAVACLSACSQQRSLLAVRESGDRNYTRGDYQAALTDYKEFTERLPGDPTGRYNLGRAYLAAGQPVHARENLFIAHSQRPDSDEYFDALCESLLAAGQHEELYRIARQRALDRQGVGDYLRVARYTQRIGDADQTEQALITAARLDGGSSASVQMALVDFYESIGDRERAMERLRMAYYLDAADPAVSRRIRGYGEIPGPTFGMRPAEAR